MHQTCFFLCAKGGSFGDMMTCWFRRDDDSLGLRLVRDLGPSKIEGPRTLPEL